MKNIWIGIYCYFFAAIFTKVFLEKFVEQNRLELY